MSSCILFAPPFFDYPSLISEELKLHFDEVEYIPLTPSNLMWKIQRYFGIESIQKVLLAKHYSNIQKKLINNTTNVETIIVVKGSIIPEFFYKWLKSNFPKTRYIQYLWDNVTTDPQAPIFSKYYDKTLSFSKEDSEKYGFLFRPFFYKYVSEGEKNIDTAFIGSMNLSRCEILNKILEVNPYLANRNNFWHIKGSKLLKFKLREVVDRLTPYISSAPLPYESMLEVLCKSKAQIDIPNPKQVGLTTRSFESLGTKTKIITTNKHIREYDFYNPNNIFVVDANNPVIPQEWLDAPFVIIPDSISDKYTLSSFITDLLK